MEWKEEIDEILEKYKGQGVADGDQLILLFPRIDVDKMSKAIKEIVPAGTKFRVIETLKPKTLEKIQGELGMGTIIKKTIIKDRSLKIFFNKSGASGLLSLVGGSKKEVKETSDVWDKVSQHLAEDGYLDSWTIFLEDNFLMHYDKKISESHKGYLDRGTINKDDLLNLKIELGKAETVEDIISSMNFIEGD